MIINLQGLPGLTWSNFQKNRLVKHKPKVVAVVGIDNQYCLLSDVHFSSSLMLSKTLFD